MTDRPTDAFRSPVLKAYADAALAYVDRLYQIDVLEAVGDFRLSEVTDALSETLELLGRLNHCGVSITPASWMMPASTPFQLDPLSPHQVLVKRARDLGASWALIGKILGMSAQGAHKAYAVAFDSGLENT